MSDGTPRPPMPHRVLMVDDHPIVLEGMAQFLGLQASLQVCCLASTARGALLAAEQCRHDLAIVDLSLRNESGLDLVKALRQHHPPLAILVLSMHEESLFAVRALKAGANGYLMKQEGTHHLLHAVRELLDGNVYLSPDMQRRIAEGFLGRNHTGRSAIANLSEREFAILHLIGLGLGTREIAERLNRSIKTIEAHRANIKEKLGLSSGQELLRFAVHLLDAG